MRVLPKLPAYGLFVAFLIATFLLGGGSRHDIASLVLLRPLACLAAAAGLLTLEAHALRGYRALFILLGALALLMVVQLVPLPPPVWSSLPDRAVVRELDIAAGLRDAWRPLTLSPMKTANALASLIVPFATLLLFIQLGARRREQILVWIVGLAVASAMLGIVQQLSGASSGYFLYDITNRGSAVGLFANRNHHAVFLSCALLIALYLWHARHQATRARRIVPLLAAAVLFVAILANPSRAGLICLCAALAMSGIALLTTPRASAHQHPPPSGRWVTFACLLAPAVAIFGLFAAAGRSPALARVLGDGQLEEYRARILPDLLAMVSAYQPWGSGFGAFEYAFRMRERVELLEPAYLNNAHNDWLQWIIEGGVGGLVLALAMAVLIVRRLVVLARTRRQGGDTIRPAWLGIAILVILAIASIVDYPLRVPAIMSLATIALALVFQPTLEQNQTSAR